MPPQEVPTDRTFLEEGWFILFGNRDAPKRPTSDHWGTWMKFFGVQPAICLELWIRVGRNDDLPVGALSMHLLWGLYFLRCYDEEEKAAIFLKRDRKRTKTKIFPYKSPKPPLEPPSLVVNIIDNSAWIHPDLLKTQSLCTGLVTDDSNFLSLYNIIIFIFMSRSPCELGRSSSKMGCLLVVDVTLFSI